MRSFTSVTGLVAELGADVTIPGTALSAGGLATTNSDAFGRLTMLLEPGQYDFLATGPAGYAPTQQVLRVSFTPQALPVELMWTNTGLDSAHTNHSPLLNMNAATAWTSDGVRGGCLTFDGADDTVNLPNGPDTNLSVNRTRTVCFWFNAENRSLTTKQVLFEDGGVTRGMSFYLEDGSLLLGAWNTPATESGWAGTWFAVPGIQAHRWYHVALTLNGGTTITQNALIGYLDASEIGRGQGSQLWGRGSKNGLGAMYDAARFQDGSQNGNGDYFSGRLDDFRIYERVLTASELGDLARSGIAHAVVQANAGPDVLNHNGLEVPLQPSVTTYGTPNATPWIGWETVTSPSSLLPRFSQPEADGIPTLASLPEAGGYELRLIADTGEIATCDDLSVSAIRSFADWIADFPGLPPDQQTPEADPDGDGVPNHIEYELGTPPTAGGSREGKGCISLRVADAGATLELSFLLRREAAARGLTYGLRRTASLSPSVWVDQAFTLLGVESTADYEFERIRLQLTPGGGPPATRTFLRLWFVKP